VLSV
jgi:hypothetical protein